MKHVIYDEDGQIVEERDLPGVSSQPLALSFRDFIMLAYEHGGLTMAKYAEAKGNPLFSIFFDMLQAADGIEKDDPFTVSGAEAFVAGGIIKQDGADAIFANWPEG